MSKSHYTSASAGTGKTYTLTHTIADLINAKELAPEKAIVTTFTRAAAADLKTKTRAVLYEKGLFDAAEQLEGSMIGTVDSIANTFVTKYWQDLDISPELRVLSPEDQLSFASSCLSECVKKEDYQLFARIQKLFGKTTSEGEYMNVPDYNFWRKDVLNIIDKALIYGFSVDKIKRDRDICLKEVARVFDKAKAVSKNDFRRSAKALFAAVDAYYAKFPQKVTEQKYTSRMELKASLDSRKNNIQFDWVKDYGTLAADSPISKNVSCIYNWFDADFIIDDVNRFASRIFELVIEVYDWFQRMKVENHYLTYTDMETYFLKLIKQNEDVRKEIASAYTHLFVDEFQDSSAIQVMIFNELRDIFGNENCYFYGDRKQVIYSWRGADVDLTTAISDGADMEKTALGTCYRSRPELVTFYNKYFENIFKEADGSKMKELVPAKKRHGILQIWDISPLREDRKIRVSKEKYLAAYIRDLIVNQHVLPSKIAVIGRKNSELTKYAMELEGKGIPVNREIIDMGDKKEIRLLMALLNIVRDSSDNLSKSLVKELTQDGCTPNEIIADGLQGGDLGDSDLVRKVLAMSAKLREMSVSEIVKTLVCSTGLFEIVKRWGKFGPRKANLLHVIDAAVEYDNKCAEQQEPSTIIGFRAVLSSDKAKSSGDNDGVVLTTIHKAKGLEWDNVIVLEPKSDELDMKNIIKKEVCGVSILHDTKPTMSNMFPDVHITYFPGYLDALASRLTESGTVTAGWYNMQKMIISEEMCRLIYVAFTRAKSRLILADEKGMKIFKEINENAGLAKDIDKSCVGNAWTSYLTRIAKPSDLVSSYDQKYECSAITYVKAASHPSCRRDYSPSKLAPGDGSQINGTVFPEIIPLSETPSMIKPAGKVADAEFGNCIHHIFALSGQWIDGSDNKITELAESYGVDLEDPAAVRCAWNSLVGFLSRFGVKVSEKHEYPFQYKDADGRVFSGDIDLLWETENGYVIIDYKTFQGKVTELVPHTEKKNYALQLSCYRKALEADGKKVLGTYIYYPVSQTIVEIKPC